MHYPGVGQGHVHDQNIRIISKSKNVSHEHIDCCTKNDQGARKGSVDI